MSTHLRFATEILSRLGEELIPHPDLGVIELVRNAYDADASRCTVTLHNATTRGGTLVVEDDGDGMTADDIREGFLLIGRSTKIASPLTNAGRRKVGEKGLGRLAALRLGHQIELATRPRSQPGVEHVLHIDWAEYESAASIDAVELTVETKTSAQGPGTSITVHRLRQGFTESEMERLSRAMRLLTGFFDDEDSGFDAVLHAPQFKRISEAVSKGFFEEHEYKLVAQLDENGQAQASLYNWKGEVIAQGEHGEVALTKNQGHFQVPMMYHAPAASFELWMFTLNKESFDHRHSLRKHSDLRPWLRIVGGVHLFHRGLRVHPYGDAGFDWLDLNLLRVRSPEHRPSTNTSVGRVRIDDPANMLVPKTDRQGFQENMAFLELRDFAARATDWAARVRLNMRETQRTGGAATARNEKKEADRKVDDVLKSLPPVQRQKVSELVSSQNRLIQELERDRLLYRSLATVGISTAVFAHESIGSAGGLGQDLETIERRTRATLGDETYSERVERVLTRARNTATSIHSFAKLPLRMLRRSKRRAKVIDINDTCREFIEMFGGYLGDWNIRLDLDLCDEPARVLTPAADIESIYANLVINAARSFSRATDATRDRVVLIRTRVDEVRVSINVADSGPGISGISLNDIWLPGEGSAADGTGLGLTIVKDIVADLHGKKTVLEDGEITVEKNGELGGASFRISLPRQPDTQ
ncbi:ATP-binding protein [Streptomyces sp. NBC_01201]|uniref:sensor histidine kinase n=1 Tax=Streptomyces sp. NBC_01201 TaxID=2903770 RepID=UPI002E11F543|nr:ATP-binding protein [Streptomyces sp. NBC_01201]